VGGRRRPSLRLYSVAVEGSPSRCFIITREDPPLDVLASIGTPPLGPLVGPCKYFVLNRPLLPARNSKPQSTRTTHGRYHPSVADPKASFLPCLLARGAVGNEVEPLWVMK
jgi:hypothetical protein